MKNKQPTVIITGASGYLGSLLTSHFLDKGWHVIGLVRHAADRPAVPNLSYAEFDLSKQFDESVFEGADYLVHTAYVKFDREHPDAFDVNVSGAERLVKASRKYKLKHTVFISSMSSHEGGISVYAKQKMAVEELFSSNNDTVLRPGLIVGNGGIVKQMAAFMKSKHVVPLIGGGTQPLQVIAVDDLVRLISRVLEKGIGGKFTVANPKVYQYKEFYTELAKAIRTKVVLVPVPYAAILGVMRLAAFLHLPLSANEENLQGLQKLIAVDTAPDLKKLGVTIDDLPAALGRVSADI